MRARARAHTHQQPHTPTQARDSEALFSGTNRPSFVPVVMIAANRFMTLLYPNLNPRTPLPLPPLSTSSPPHYTQHNRPHYLRQVLDALEANHRVHETVLVVSQVLAVVVLSALGLVLPRRLGLGC